MAFCDSIKLEKGMYTVSGKSFTKVLEGLDPSENYKGTELEGLDAYQRQLKRFDIKVSGAGCDKVEKFFSTADSAVLFPEFIARAVKQGLEASNVLPSMVATTTVIDGIDYRAISSTTDGTGTSVSEAAAMRNVNVRTKSNLITLKKHGRVFSSSYEALRFQNLDVLTVILRQIGADIAKEQLADATAVLLNGDGNSNAVTPTVLSSVTGITYDHLVQLWQSIAPHEMNVILASTRVMKDILSLTEMRDACAGLNFQGTGNLVTPLGAKLIYAPGLDEAENADKNGKILGFDKNCTLQMVQDGDITIDYDKVIEQQLDRAAISMTTGFAKIVNDSVKALSYTVSE